MTAPAASGERLQKVLARRGIGSRRTCEELIAAGRVRVNGEVAVLGRRVDPDQDRVEVDGSPVGVKPDLVYYLLNKPSGVVTTAADTHGRPTVVDLVPSSPRVFPVGGTSLSDGIASSSTIVGGSFAAARFTVGAGSDALIRATGPSGGTLFAPVTLTIVRVK